MNVRLRLINAYQDYLKHNQQLPNVVRMSKLTALDFAKLGVNEIGEDMCGEILKRGPIPVLEEKGVPGVGELKIIVDLPIQHLDDTTQSEFVFEYRSK